MKIATLQVPPEGLAVHEVVPAGSLDLGTPVASLHGPLEISGTVYLITNALEAKLTLKGEMMFTCSRCLKEFTEPLQMQAQLNIEVPKGATVVDLTDEIREEIILEYPMIPLCSGDCKGLCIACGGDLNQGTCHCHHERS